jgi:hypothetical protein
MATQANEFKIARVAKATYDYSVHGGATGNALGLGVYIPAGAIVTRVIGSAVTSLDSGGSATVAINIGSTEVNAATAFDHADYTAVDVHYSTPVKLSATSEVNLDIATAALTAGVYDIYVEYVL